MDKQNSYLVTGRTPDAGKAVNTANALDRKAVASKDTAGSYWSARSEKVQSPHGAHLPHERAVPTVVLNCVRHKAE